LFFLSLPFLLHSLLPKPLYLPPPLSFILFPSSISYSSHHPLPISSSSFFL
jgi:hypothetical protein